MYRNVSSPIFDIPEFPTLRRVKPLPKRRKTLDGSGDSTSISVLNAKNGDGSVNGSTPRMLVAETNGVPHSLHMPGLPPIPLSLPGPDATAEQLLAHADALQSYYLPILDAAAASIGKAADGFVPSSTTTTTTASAEDLAASYAALTSSLRDRERERDRDRDQDSDQADGDYLDHLQQPGNTKKRKVPTATLRPASVSGEDDQESLDGQTLGMIPSSTIGIDVSPGIGTDTGQDDAGGGGDPKSSSSPSSTPVLSTTTTTTLRLLSGRRRKSRLSAVTLAGLQHKETLKVRKRQLAAVLGALSHGDTLALDQALTGSGWPFPFLYSYSSTTAAAAERDSSLTALEGEGNKAPKFRVRLSKRANPRTARVVRAKAKTLGKENEEPKLEWAIHEGEFTFECHSATTDRLEATKAEVATLRRRFENELTRQASNAASLAAAAKNTSRRASTGTTKSKSSSKAVTGAVHGSTGGTAGAKSGRQKRVDRERERERQTRARMDNGAGNVVAPLQHSNMNTHPSATVPSATPNSKSSSAQVPQPAGAPSTPTPTKSKSKPKKKKRSALANASNPHHLRNYVPSRLPYSDGGGYGYGYQGHGQGVNVQAHANDLGPFPSKFLNAEIPPRRKGEGARRLSQQNQNVSQSQPGMGMGGGIPSNLSRNQHSSSKGQGLLPSSPPNSNSTVYSNSNANSTLMTNRNSSPTPATAASATTDEWLCIFCEYELFFGEEVEFHRAVRKRKAVLKRRRRARERAEEVASGRRAVAAVGNNDKKKGQQQPQPVSLPLQPQQQDEEEEEEEREEDDYGDGDEEYEDSGQGRYIRDGMRNGVGDGGGVISRSGGDG